jgi:hypothetical protein
MKRTWINCSALTVLVVAGSAMFAPRMAHAEAALEAECKIGDVVVKGDICTSDGKTCKCA